MLKFILFAENKKIFDEYQSEFGPVTKELIAEAEVQAKKWLENNPKAKAKVEKAKKAEGQEVTVEGVYLKLVEKANEIKAYFPKL